MDEIAVLFDYLHELDVDGFMISPAFGYAAVRDVAPTSAADIFMTRDEVHAKFRSARATLKRFRLTASPIYMEFLRGERDLTCAAWANPTYNVRGCARPLLSVGRRPLQNLPRTGRGDRLEPPAVPAAIRVASTV